VHGALEGTGDVSGVIAPVDGQEQREGLWHNRERRQRRDTDGELAATTGRPADKALGALDVVGACRPVPDTGGSPPGHCGAVCAA
jgi:hypothetical protein